MAPLSVPGGTWHALGLLDVGENAPLAQENGVGLFHFALEVPSIANLIEVRKRLVERGALGREHDHGATEFVYGRDPDGHNFEVMFELPPDEWGQWTHEAVRMPLDLDAELARWG